MLHRCGWEHSCHSAPYTGSYGTVNTIVTQQPGLGNEDRTYSIEPEGKCIWWGLGGGRAGSVSNNSVVLTLSAAHETGWLYSRTLIRREMRGDSDNTHYNIVKPG